MNDPVAVKETQVVREMNEIQELTQALFKEYEMLEEKVQPVLSALLEEGNEKPLALPVLVPLAATLADHKHALIRLRNKMETLRNRIEL